MPVTRSQTKKTRSGPKAAGAAGGTDNVSVGDSEKAEQLGFLQQLCSTFGWTHAISPAGLHHIKTHQYVSGAYTPLDLYLNDFWFAMTEKLPLWLAPNLVTLCGFFFILSALACILPTIDGFQACPPPWALLWTGACIIIYQTLDAMDGKQARRTNSSTPLGALFDHGCDAVVLVCATLFFVMVCLPLPPIFAMLLLLLSGSMFFLAQWRDYHFNELLTSMGPLGVTEAQFIVAGGCILHALYPALLHSPISVPPALAFMLPSLLQGQDLQVRHAHWSFIIGLTLVLLALLVSNTLLRLAKKSAAHALTGLLQLLAPLSVVVLALTWPSESFARNPVLLFVCVGILMTHQTVQMIVLGMSKQTFPVLQGPVVFAFAIRISLEYGSYSKQHEDNMLLSLIGVAGFSFLSWVLKAIGQITKHLNIEAFRIPYDAKSKSS